VSGWLLDTNVVSAFGPGKRPIPANIAAWFRARTEALYLSTISASEIEGGIAKLRRTGSGRRNDNLCQWFDWILGDYADRLLTLDLAAASRWHESAAELQGAIDSRVTCAGIELSSLRQKTRFWNKVYFQPDAVRILE
jgi:predicted nucleic acid-binding protein